MMDELEKETSPPDVLKARVIQTLERRGLLHDTRRPWQLAIRAAALLAVFIGGWLIGSRASARPDAPQPATSQYLFLLYEDDSFQPDRPSDELVAEYAAWAAALRSEGKVSSAEQLGPDAWLVGGADTRESVPRTGPYGDVTGFFVILAESDSAAIEIARTCPHVRHGGRIAVRHVMGA